MSSKILRNDMVYVKSGNNKGKIGKVLRVFYKKEHGCRSAHKLLVSSINMKKILNKNKRAKIGGKDNVILKESPIDVSNVMFWDEKTKTFGRVKFKISDDRKKYRIFAPTGEKIDNIGF